MKKSVLLICGGGASSGFLAQRIRKTAKKRKMEIEVLARSESELNDYLDTTDVVLIAPHLSYIKEDIDEQLKGHNIPSALIDEKTYSLLDGEKGLDLILNKLDEA